MTHICQYPNCEEPAVACCDHCDRYFCPDHGTPGGDHQVQDVGAVAFPSQCWMDGGFNADEGLPTPQDSSEPRTELHALLERVRDLQREPAYPDRNAVAYDCLRMFEEVAVALMQARKDTESSTRDKDVALMAAAQLIADRFSAGHPDTAQQVLEIAKEITAKEAA